MSNATQESPCFRKIAHHSPLIPVTAYIPAFQATKVVERQLKFFTIDLPAEAWFLVRNTLRNINQNPIFQSMKSRAIVRPGALNSRLAA